MATLAPPRRDPPGRVKNSLFLRLRWNIFGHLSEIQVEDGLDENGAEKLTPFLSHPIAEESIAQPPVTVASISSLDTAGAILFYVAPYGWEDKSLLIEHTDGRPITLRDVVTRLHEYLNEPLHKQLIITMRKRVIPSPTGMKPYNYHTTMPDPKIFMKHVHARIRDSRATLSVSTFAIGELGISEEEFWARRKVNRLPY